MILSPLTILERNLDGTRRGVLLKDSNPCALSVDSFRDIVRSMFPDPQFANMDILFTATGLGDGSLLAFFNGAKRLRLEVDECGEEKRNDDVFWEGILAEARRQLNAQDREMETRFGREDPDIEVAGTFDTPEPRTPRARFEYLGDGRWNAHFRNQER